MQLLQKAHFPRYENVNGVTYILSRQAALISFFHFFSRIFLGSKLLLVIYLKQGYATWLATTLQ